MTHPLASDKPEVCAVCRRHAMALGYRPHIPAGDGLPLIWVCADPVCQSLLEKVYGMANEKLDAFEHKAAMAAGDQAGQWLDSIGKTDLAALTGDEWEELLGRIVLGFQAELRRILQAGEAPF